MRRPEDIEMEVGYVVLPCGSRGIVEDQMGVRCCDCMCVYGSIACPCTRNREVKRSREAAQRPAGGEGEAKP